MTKPRSDPRDLLLKLLIVALLAACGWYLRGLKADQADCCAAAHKAAAGVEILLGGDPFTSDKED